LSRRRLRLFALRCPLDIAGSCDAVSTFFEVECRCEVTEVYFRFFRRFVFFAVFFAADFVFDLALFAMLPS
jgi:hypothetical protein